jgi:hypothetical protein
MPGRRRIREEDVEHGTDRGYRLCRAGSGGKRCNACLDAHADAEARRAAARRGLGEPPPQPSSPQPSASVTVLPTPAAAVVVDDGPGAIEQAVLDEAATLSAAVRRPSAVQTAVRLARDLDNPKLAVSHASLARQLSAVMDSLRAASSARQSRLATVAQMSQRRPASGVG